MLGGTGRTALILDETAFAKKGRSSVGVARQWNGRLGKTDNCQAAVFGVLSAGDRALMVDTEFFLPEEWTDDPSRCRKAGVPEERFSHQTKTELALTIVRRQRQAGIRFDYVCADGLYGHSGPLCRSLEDDGEVFLMHVHANKNVYLENPAPVVPERRSSRGRPPSQRQAQSDPIRVDELYKRSAPDDFQLLTLRNATKGPLEVEAYRRSVWVWDSREEEARPWTLYIRREVNSPQEVNYCLTNASDDLPLVDLARMEAQRFWIEHAFEEAKSEVGMAEYQVRGWTAWHHHIALVMMAMLFLTKQRILFAKDAPLLSCRDIKHLLAHFLPRRDSTLDEILRQIEIRHAKRRADTENAFKRKKSKHPLPIPDATMALT